MKIKFYNKTDFAKCCAAIHSSGKLGFNKQAFLLMKLDKRYSIYVGKSDNKNEFILKTLYYLNRNSFKIYYAKENYAYINCSELFDLLSIDYANKKYTFNITQSKSNKNMFILSLNNA